MTTSRRAGIAAALTISALALAACGGTTATSGPGATASSPAATAAPSAAAPSAAATAEASPSSAVAIPSFDLGGLIQNLEGVDSYRVAISVGGEPQYEGVVVTKPVLSRDVTISAGGTPTRLVVIGDEAWLGTGDDLQPAPAEMASGMLTAFDPTMLVGAFASPAAMTGAEELGTEEKNGVRAHHFRIDSGSFVGTMASMPPGSFIDLWIADEGYLVSLSMEGLGDNAVSIDVTDVNDPANVVERPR